MKKKYSAEEIERKKSYIVQRAFESIPGRIIIDEDGIILFFSEQHEKYTGVPASEAVGRHVTEVIPNSRLHIAVKTGQAEIGVLSYYANRKQNEIVPEISNRIPVFDGERIIGALGIGIISDYFDFNDLPGNLASADIFNLDRLKGTQEKKTGPREAVLKGMVAISPQMLEIKKMIRKIAPSPLPVLITGETGTGKEVLASAIHEASGRKAEDFVQINCAAIPGELLESELFGYESGAFSGAARGGKIGKFEHAGDGTILLDEIGDMPLPLQAKLLRVIQEKKFEKIGGIRSIPFKARIISTTNQDLTRLIREGAFRQDLYYRINAVEIYIPPLRERIADVEALCCQFIDNINQELDLSINGIEVEALRFLTEYQWPGNIRELRNVIEKACCMSEDQVLRKEQFGYLAAGRSSLRTADKKMVCESFVKGTGSELGDRTPATEDRNISLGLAKEKAETEKILWALGQTGGNKAGAARLLQISRSVLYDRIRRYRIKL